MVMNRKTTVEVTDFAAEAWHRMTSRVGIKTAVSAAVLAFDSQTSEMREAWIDKANGKDVCIESILKQCIQETVREELEKLLKGIDDQPSFLYKVLSEDDSKELARLRELLGPGHKMEIKKKKA